MEQKIAFIINGASNRAGLVSLQIEELSKSYPEFRSTIVFTTEQGHAEILAESIVAQDYTGIIACGGDGTLNEVVNGIRKAKSKASVSLGLFPIGSANDYAKNLKPLSLKDVFILIEQKGSRTVDLVELTTPAKSRFSINMAAAGIGAEIAITVNSRKKKLPAAINYYTGIIQWLLKYQAPLCRIKLDDTVIQQRCFLVAAGKGKYAGNGLGLLPQSELNDSMISLCVIGDVSVIDFLKYQSDLKKCKAIVDPRVRYLQSKTVEIEVIEGSLAVDTDGEFFTRVNAGETIQYRIEPSALKLI